MKSLINLANTVFDLTEMVHDAPMTLSWSPKGPVKVPDFGTVFIGLDKVKNSEFMAEIERAAVGDGPLFLAPEGWRWPQMARALGVFPSAARAASNGWDGDIPSGFTVRLARINKIRGEFTFVKIDEKSPWA